MKEDGKTCLITMLASTHAQPLAEQSYLVSSVWKPGVQGFRGEQLQAHDNIFCLRSAYTIATEAWL